MLGAVVSMQLAVRVGASGFAVSVALVAANGTAAAAPKPISGKLSKPGYTVLALAANGQVKAVRATRGRFRLRPPAKRVTLHLRAPSGTYAGPVVIGREKRGRRAIVGVRAGTRLGRVRVRGGYAKVSKRIRKKWIDASRLARARRGVPIGARVFGRVRSKPPRVRVPGDNDLDGIPDPLDIDDDGDLILDSLDRSTAPRAAQAPQGISLTFGLGLDVSQTVNANAAAVTDTAIDEALSGPGANLGLGTGATSAELDCGRDDPTTPTTREGLPYCSSGDPPSTGRFKNEPFPGAPGGPFDPDRDGQGTLLPAALGFQPFATSAEIRTGQQLIAHVNDVNGITTGTYTATLEFIFATVPALASYHDTAGNSATLSYPYPPGSPPVLPVAPGPDGDIVVTVTFWPPQRRPIKGEKCPPPEARLCSPNEWIDIGGLGYSVGGPTCPATAFSEDDPTTPVVEDDPNLLPREPRGFQDSAPDRPASATNTFRYTLNVTQCLGSNWDGAVEFHAFGGGSARQHVLFRRQGGRLTVKKQTDPAESSTAGTEFEFDPDTGPDANFKLRHDGTRTIDLPPGTYTVDELPVSGYDLTAVACDDSDSTGSTTDRRATFRIALNEHVTCTFTNKKL